MSFSSLQYNGSKIQRSLTCCWEFSLVESSRRTSATSSPRSGLDSVPLFLSLSCSSIFSNWFQPVELWGEVSVGRSFWSQDSSLESVECWVTTMTQQKPQTWHHCCARSTDVTQRKKRAGALWNADSPYSKTLFYLRSSSNLPFVGRLNLVTYFHITEI